MQIFTRDKHCTNKIQFLPLVFFLALQLLHWTSSAWEVDLSRRRQERQQKDIEVTFVQKQPTEFFDQALTNSEPVEDIVVINTQNGFVPSTVRLRRDRRYNFRLVNVNKGEKNISFVADAFSQHHSTYFGEVKTFTLEPKREGIYSFQCPETGAQGRIVVYGGAESLPIRLPASTTR
jgi:hypothetical protein